VYVGYNFKRRGESVRGRERQSENMSSLEKEDYSG